MALRYAKPIAQPKPWLLPFALSQAMADVDFGFFEVSTTPKALSSVRDATESSCRQLVYRVVGFGRGSCFKIFEFCGIFWAFRKFCFWDGRVGWGY